MVNYFKPEDFTKPHPSGIKGISMDVLNSDLYKFFCETAADLANDKLSRAVILTEGETEVHVKEYPHQIEERSK